MLVKYGRADFLSLFVLQWASLTVFTSRFVSDILVSLTNQLTYFSDLNAFFAKLLDRASLLSSSPSRPSVDSTVLKLL